jgi:hypothetical protein
LAQLLNLDPSDERARLELERMSRSPPDPLEPPLAYLAASLGLAGAGGMPAAATVAATAREKKLGAPAPSTEPDEDR